MNIGIIGCGVMGELHAQLAAECGHRIVACADTSRSKAKQLAKTYKDHGAEAVKDGMNVAGQPEVEVVVINTPTPTHGEFIKAAAENGKHIFCEKPLGRTAAECEEAVQAAKSAGVKLFVGHVVRYFHEFETIKGLVEAGKAGEPGFVKTYRGGMAPQGEGGWFRDVAQSGGVVFDCSIHDLDWIRYAFGEVERVFCQTVHETKPDVIDYAMVTLRLKNGMIGQVIGTWAHPSGFRVKAEVCGSRGVLQFDSAQTAVETHMRKTARGDDPSVIVPGSPVDKSPYLLEWEDFTKWLNGEGEPRVTPEDAVSAVRIAEAALKSAETGAPVTL